MTRQQEEQSDRTNDEAHTLFQLVRALINDAADLVRLELELFRLEIAENLARGARAASMSAIGGALTALGFLVLLQAVILGLGLLLGGRYWLATLIVAITILAAGGALIYLGGRRISRAKFTPDRSLESIGETRSWITTEIDEFRTRLKSREPAVKTSPIEPPLS